MTSSASFCMSGGWVEWSGAVPKRWRGSFRAANDQFGVARYLPHHHRSYIGSAEASALLTIRRWRRGRSRAAIILYIGSAGATAPPFSFRATHFVPCLLWLVYTKNVARYKMGGTEGKGGRGSSRAANGTKL